MIDGYYNRFDPAKNYQSHLFRAGYVLQSAELNEVQSSAQNHVKGIADALFKDGDIIRDCVAVVNADTGNVTMSAGALYLKGMVRGVAPASFTIPVDQTLAIGVYLQETVVTELEDPDLRDPASLTRNYMEPGASRLQVVATWGWSGAVQDGEFYPVYTVENGILLSKEPPPNLDAFTQSLARYDRDSAGGTYVVSGLGVRQLDDDNGEQVYSIAEGRARVNGYGVELAASRRFRFDPEPDLRFIDAEPHQSTTAGSQTITLDRYPIANVTTVRITTEKTVTLTHGAFVGAQDPLPDSSVLSIIEVKQGGTTYTAGSDYKLTAGKVDWSLAGAEPSPGSTYTATYQYVTTVVPSEVTASTVTITGAVVDSLVLVSYNYKMARVDRIAIDQQGKFSLVKGVAAEWSPQPPVVPDGLLSLATITQTWDSGMRVVNDGVRVVPMNELSAINGRIDYVLNLVAQQRLESDINLREAGVKKGVFTDPFMTDEMRDQGQAQTAAIIDGELTLPIDASVDFVDADIASPQTLAYVHEVALQQTLRTGSMLINPYMSFSPIPAEVSLSPSVDRWTQVDTQWASPVTRRFLVGSGDQSSVSRSTSTVMIGSASSNIERLRAIEVRFDISGFGPGEILNSVTFGGQPVTPSAL